MGSTLLIAVIVALTLVVRGVHWGGPPVPNVQQVLEPATGQQPPHVQSGAVPPDAHP